MIEAKWVTARDPGKFETQEFILQDTERQRPVTGAVWLPESSKSTDAIIAFGHGASGDRYQAPIPYLVHRLVRKGYFCISMDGPVHGLRQKQGGGRAALGEEMRSNDLTSLMNLDWQIAIEYASERFGFDDNRFAYFGLSMGSIFGIPMLADRERREKPVTAAVLGLLGTNGAVVQLRDNLRADAQLLQSPILFLMQMEDELFPRDGYLDLFDHLGTKEKTLHANPGLHPEVPAIEFRHTIDFLTQHLEQD